MADLSAYELQRLENIRRNEAALAALGLGPGGSVALNKKPLPKRRAQRVKGQTLATRASARLAASGRMDRDLDSDLDPDSDPDLGSDPGSDPGNQTQTSKARADRGCTLCKSHPQAAWPIEP